MNKKRKEMEDTRRLDVCLRLMYVKMGLDESALRSFDGLVQCVLLHVPFRHVEIAACIAKPGEDPAQIDARRIKALRWLKPGEGGNWYFTVRGADNFFRLLNET